MFLKKLKCGLLKTVTIMLTKMIVALWRPLRCILKILKICFNDLKKMTQKKAKSEPAKMT